VVAPYLHVLSSLVTMGGAALATDADPGLRSENEASGSGSEHVIEREEHLTSGQEGELCHLRNPSCLPA
jgi:hypothetical protein